MQLLNRPWLIALTRIVTFAIAAAAVLAGCTRTVTQTVTRDVVRPAPTPSLLGTWTGTEQVRDDNGVLTGTHVYTLTFTKSRTIAVASVRDAAGREFDRWREVGTWSATANTVTRTWYGDDENDRRMSEPTHLAKNYAFADEGNVLLINPWFWTTATDGYWYNTRVKTPIQDLLTGTWEESRDLSDRNWRETITLSPDNSFTWRSVTTRGDIVRTELLEGPYVHDAENGFILVTITAVTYTRNGVPFEPEAGEGEFVGHTLRWAYAPTERADIIAVSSYWEEQKWNPTTRMWDDRSDLTGDDFVPYGNYDRRYKRIDRTN